MKQKTKPILNKILKHLMLEKGVTAKQVGLATGIPQATLSSLMNGGSTNKPEYLLALSEYFGRSIDYLLFGRTSKPIPLSQVPTKKLFSGWAKISVEIPDEMSADNIIIDEREGDP